MNIEIERAKEDGLTYEFWSFSMHYFPHVNLVRYGFRERKSKRHKAVVVKKWDTYSERESNLPKPESIPNDVIKEVYDRLFRLIADSNLYIGARAESENIYKKGE